MTYPTVTPCIDEAHLERQIAFSERTFGPGPRTEGVVDHIRKELKEVLEHPSDLKEWVDVIILGFDGAWRAGHKPHEIIAAIKAKQLENEGRTWPDWRTADVGKAIEHVRELPRAIIIGSRVTMRFWGALHHGTVREFIGETARVEWDQSDPEAIVPTPWWTLANLTLEDGPAFVAVDERKKSCTDNWPGAASGEYDPRCCRFPKSCSVRGRYGLVPRGEA